MSETLADSGQSVASSGFKCSANAFKVSNLTASLKKKRASTLPGALRISAGSRVSTAASENSEASGESSACGCCALCLFKCFSCCGCRDMLCRGVLFAPPRIPYYKIVDGVLHRMPKREWLATMHRDWTRNDAKRIARAVFPRRVSAQVVRIRTSLGRSIVGCLLRHPDAKRTIFFAHGNATDIGGQSYISERLVAAQKVNVFIFDYTGYGLSDLPQRPSVVDLIADGRAAYKWLTTEGNVDPLDLVLCGQSLGSAVVCDLGAHQRVLGVIVQSGFASVLRVVRPNLVSTSRYDVLANCDMIKQCKSPVFIIHGCNDRVISVRHGRTLAKSAMHTVGAWFVEKGTHNNIEHDFVLQYYKELNKAFDLFEKARDSDSMDTALLSADAKQVASDSLGGKISSADVSMETDSKCSLIIDQPTPELEPRTPTSPRFAARLVMTPTSPTAPPTAPLIQESRD